MHELLSLKILRKLNLSNNNIRSLWELPRSIEQLNLSRNSLISLERVLPSLSLLQILDISSNYLTSLLPLSGLIHLRCLYAGNNRISSISGVESSKSLIELDLENNFVTVDELEAFDKNSSICAVNILNNPLARY